MRKSLVLALVLWIRYFSGILIVVCIGQNEALAKGSSKETT